MYIKQTNIIGPNKELLHSNVYKVTEIQFPNVWHFLMYVPIAEHTVFGESLNKKLDPQLKAADVELR